MKVIYVAGPYRADTEWGVVQNIRHAEEAAIRLWKEGWAVLCPHKNSALLGGSMSGNVQHDARTWLEGGLELLRRSDAIYMLRGWTSSQGAIEEFRLAIRLNLQILFE